MFGRDRNQQSAKAQLRELIRKLQSKYDDLNERYNAELDAYRLEHLPQWEYLEETDPKPTHLSALGQQGWELVAVSADQVRTHSNVFTGTSSYPLVVRYIFKRPIIRVPKNVQSEIMARFPELKTLGEQIQKLKAQLAEL